MAVLIFEVKSKKASSMLYLSIASVYKEKIFKKRIVILRYFSGSAHIKIIFGQSFFASQTGMAVLMPYFFASIEGAIMIPPRCSQTPIGLPRKKGFACCS